MQDHAINRLSYYIHCRTNTPLDLITPRLLIGLVEKFDLEEELLQAFDERAILTFRNLQTQCSEGLSKAEKRNCVSSIQGIQDKAIAYKTAYGSLTREVTQNEFKKNWEEIWKIAHVSGQTAVYENLDFSQQGVS